MPLFDTEKKAKRQGLSLNPNQRWIDKGWEALEGQDLRVQPNEEQLIALGKGGSDEDRTLGGTLKDIAITGAKGIVGAGEAAVGLADIPTFGRVGRGMEKYLGYDPTKTQEFLGGYYSEPQKEAFRKVEEAKGFIGTVKEMAKSPSTIGHAVVESAPLMLGGAAAARKLLASGALKMTPVWNRIIASAMGEGLVSAGATAEGIRQQTKDGYLTPKQAAISAISGAGTALFAIVGGRVAQKFGIIDPDTFLAGGSNVKPAGIIKRIIGGGISEGAFEELPQSMQEQVWLNAALDKPLLEGTGEAGATGMLTGFGMGAGFNIFTGKPVTKKGETGDTPPPAEPNNLIAAIDESMSTGKIINTDQDFTPEIAMGIIKQSYEDKILSDADLESLGEKYPELKNDIIGVKIASEISIEVQDAEKVRREVEKAGIKERAEYLKRAGLPKGKPFTTEVEPLETARAKFFEAPTTKKEAADKARAKFFAAKLPGTISTEARAKKDEVDRKWKELIARKPFIPQKDISDKEYKEFWSEELDKAEYLRQSPEGLDALRKQLEAEEEAGNVQPEYAEWWRTKLDRMEQTRQSVIGKELLAKELAEAEGLPITPKVEPKAVKAPIIPKIEIPELQDTTQAKEFGKMATPEQISRLKELRQESLDQSKALRGQGKFDKAMEEATRGQFYREAVEEAQQPVEKVAAEKVAKEPKLPIKDDETPLVAGRDHENLLSFLDEINSPYIQSSMGDEKLIKSVENIDITKTPHGGWRFLYKNEKGENISVIQGVTRKGESIVSNVYTRKDYRRQGIADALLNVVKKSKRNLSLDRHLTEEGAALFGYAAKPQPSKPEKPTAPEAVEKEIKAEAIPEVAPKEPTPKIKEEKVEVTPEKELTFKDYQEKITKDLKGKKLSDSQLIEYAEKEKLSYFGWVQTAYESLSPKTAEDLKKEIATLVRRKSKIKRDVTTRAQATTREANLGKIQGSIDAKQEALRALEIEGAPKEPTPKVEEEKAKVAPEKEYFITTREGTTKKVKGKPVSIEGFEKYDFFYSKDDGKFVISEATSGFRIATEPTLKGAKATAEITLDANKAELDKKIKEAQRFKKEKPATVEANKEAYGSQEKADAAIESVAKGISDKRMPDRAGVEESEVVKELRTKKRVDFTGRKLTAGNESQEIAELFQVYRSPKLEILHTIYTSEDGTILGHNAMTSGQIDYVSPGDMAKYMHGMKSAAKRLGATKVHVLHNHPSGNETMSQMDVNFAARISNNLGTQMGEFIVIDHGKFTRIQQAKNDAVWVDTGEFKMPEGIKDWTAGKVKISSEIQMAQFGASLAYDKTKAVFIYLGSQNEVQGWTIHDKKILAKGNASLRDTVQQQIKAHDATRAVLIADSPVLLKRIVVGKAVGGWLVDVQDVKGNSLRAEYPNSFSVGRELAKKAWGLFEPKPKYATKPTIDYKELLKKYQEAGVRKPSFQETTEPVTEADYTSNRAESRNVRLIAATNAKRVVSEIAEGVDKFLGSISTRLGNVSPKLKAKMRKLDFDINTKSADNIRAVQPLLEKAKKMNRDDFADWDYARKNSEVNKIGELVKKYSMEKEYIAYRKVLDDIRKEGLDVGLEIGEIEEYAPRVLKDNRGFLKEIGKPEYRPLYSDRLKARAQEMGTTVEAMPHDMKADMISNIILGGWVGLGGIPATKHRVLQKIPANLNKYYMDSDAALMQHLHSMRKGIEARKFFGKIPKKVAEFRTRMYNAQAKIRDLNKQLDSDLAADELEKLRKRRNKYIGLEKQYAAYISKYADQRNYKESIGAYVLELIEKKEIDAKHEAIVNEILNARFHEVGTRGVIQAYKNLSYIDTMGSPISALTQIGDLAWAAYEGGLILALKYAYKSATKQSRITKEDVGVERIAQEFADAGTLGNAVSKVFKMVGLEKIDSIGKEALLNTALDKYQVRAKKEPAKLKREIRQIFEGETDSVIDDLVNDEISDNVKLLVYSRLLDFQPVGLSEMPQMYLDAGNGRLFYMLKTFTIKVFDVYRNEVYNKIKKGDKAEKIQGLKNLARLSFFFVLANAGADELKDWALGRKTDFSDRMVDNVLRLFGVSKFVTWKARTEGVGSALARQILPPFKLIDSAGKDIITAGDEKGLEVIGSIPVVGKIAYWHLGRGTSKRDDLWDRRLRKRKAKLKKVQDKLEKSKDKRAFRVEHRQEILELRKANKLQGRLNKYRKKINHIKSRPETREGKVRIQRLEEIRTGLIKNYLGKR